MQFSLDVVTDGSEHTTSTIFLTVSRSRLASCDKVYTDNDCKDAGDEHDTITARYALSGISTLTSRLAADQKLKLSPVRAVFCPSIECTDASLSPNIPCVTGIPSLLLSLSNYSLTGKLHIVGGKKMDIYVNDVAEIILQNRRYPKIDTCVVPLEIDMPLTWWKVYDDEYVHVHARFYCKIESAENESFDDSSRYNNGIQIGGSRSDDDSSPNRQNQERRKPTDIVYIFTLHREKYSFAVFPPNLGNCGENILHPLPAEVDYTSQEPGCREGKPLEFILHVNPHYCLPPVIHGFPCEEWKIQVHPKVQILAKSHVATIRTGINKNKNDEFGGTDEGLLIRSLDQARILHSQLPFAYPLDASSERSLDLNTASPSSGFVKCEKRGYSRLCSLLRIRSCTSLMLDTKSKDNDSEITTRQALVINRKAIIENNMVKSRDNAKVSGGVFDLIGLNKNKIRELLPDLKSFYTTRNQMTTCSAITGVSSRSSIRDFNEINLSSSDEEGARSSIKSRDGDEIDITDNGDTEDLVSGPYTKYVMHSKDTFHPKKRKASEVSDLERPTSNQFCTTCPLNNTVPQLIVLGTGCASPAPLRGSSGYAIFLPTVHSGTPCLDLSIVMECGEGFLTMLGRHTSNCRLGVSESRKQTFERNLSAIHMIWISHAHLDHYGDLPNLLHEITSIKERGSGMCICYDRKGNPQKQRKSKRNCDDKNIGVYGNRHRPVCKRCERTLPPFVVAPSKVLRFLDISLQCKNGQSNGERIYIGVTQREFSSSPFCQQIREDILGIDLLTESKDNSSCATYRPIDFLVNIPVDHCPDAFACVIGINVPSATGQISSIFTLGYSGDTRPSLNFIRACNNLRSTRHLNVSLLLHEATFDDDDKGKTEASKKKHSTVMEAMDVARQIKANAVLLTHFSQRYPKYPPGYQTHNTWDGHLRTSKELKIASAYDGMTVPLKENLSHILPVLGSLAAIFISSENV